MASSLLASLVVAGVVERAGPRGRANLRVSPRFLAHAEGTAGRLRMQGHVPGPQALLEAALLTWDDARLAPRAGARFLAGLLGEREQWGPLQPVFPDLGSFQMATPIAIE